MEDYAALSAERWILIGWAVLCGSLDCWRRRLPNWLTLGGSAAALLMLVAKGQGWMGTSWTSCLSAGLIASLLTLPAYKFRLLGAGDAKMLIAVALLGGTQALLITYAFAGLFTGVATIIWIWAYHSQAWFARRFVQTGIRKFSVPEPKGWRLPFGLALSIGFVIAIAGQQSHIFDIFKEFS